MEAPGRGARHTWLPTAANWRRAPTRHKFYVLVFDSVVSAAAFYLALNFSNGRGIVFVDLRDPLSSALYTAAFGAITLVAAYYNGIHRTVWRYTSLMDCLRIVRAVSIAVLLFFPFAFLTMRSEELPRSTPLIAWFLAIAFIGTPRVVARAWTDRNTPRPFSTFFPTKESNRAAAQVILAGKIARIEPFVREIKRQPDAPYLVVGILTAETQVHGRIVLGTPILGGYEDIAEALTFLQQRDLRPQRLVLADDDADEKMVSLLLELAAKYGLTLGRLPRLTEFDGTGNNSHSEVKPIAIADLLGRPQRVLNKAAVAALVKGRRVLVTGAGGSIGSELARQLSDLAPQRLALLENCEFNLYSIDKEISNRRPDLQRTPILCDVRDKGLLQRWFAEEMPEIIFHAAALKHVPIVEAHPGEGVKTNAMGTQNVADAATAVNARAMVLISTDKAVNPHNVMGTAKRLAEAYCQAMDCACGSTRFISVRFGNVLGSTGSVVPLFQEQLEIGGPITVTHPDITRYFMSIPEAVALVLQSAALGLSPGADRGAVYVLDMGNPIRIADLARQMIRLSGKRPDIDIKIEYVGLRPGEKLHEELVHKREDLAQTSVAGISALSPRTVPIEQLRADLLELARLADGEDCLQLLKRLKAAVPEATFEVDVLPASASRVRKLVPAALAVWQNEIQPDQRTVAARPPTDTVKPGPPSPRPHKAPD